MANKAGTTGDLACDHCGVPVKTVDDHIECMGFCDQVTHIKCAKLDGPSVKNIQERSSLFWMCRQCTHLMSLARFKNVMSSIGCAISFFTDNHGEKISELKQAISDNGKQMELLSRKVSASTPLSSRSAEGQPAQKRRREEKLRDPKPLLGGTKTLPSASVLTVPPPKEMFWLYLSRIHPSVKSEAVTALVNDCLQCKDSVKVVPLVRKDADLAAMNFISFKVGIDKKYRNVALDPATWPQGIVFREFEGLSTRSSWMPTDTSTSNVAPRIQLTSTSGSSQSTNFLSPNSVTGPMSMDSL